MLCPAWTYDDVPSCARTLALFYGPLVFGSISVFLFVANIIVAKFRASKATELGEENRPLLASPDAYGAVPTHPDAVKVDLTIKQRHFDLSQLLDTNDDGTPHGQLQEVPKGLGDRLRVACEYVLVLFLLAISVATFFSRTFADEWRLYPVSLVLLLYWLYAFVLCSIRVVNMSRVKISVPAIWGHSTALYLFYFWPALVFCRSSFVGHIEPTLVQRFYQANCAATVILVVLNLTTKIGDKPELLYVTSDGAKPSPERISSLWQFLTYSWIDPMIWKARKESMTKDDIWGLREDDYALSVLREFKKSSLKARFTWKLFAHFKVLFLLQFFWAILDSILIFMPTFFLKKILEYVADPSSTTQSVAWCFVIVMPCTKMLDSLASGFSLFLGRRVCVRMRAIIVGEVYAKALRRKITTSEDSEEAKDKDAKQKKPADNADDSSNSGSSKVDAGLKKTSELGAIINLMAVDAFKVSEICGYLHFFVNAILMLTFCIFLLYKLLGWSAMVGGSVIFLLFPVNYKCAMWVGQAQKKMLEITDKRIQKMNETFSSIRIIKFFAWEENFFKSIMNIREQEIYYLKLRVFCWGAQACIWFIIPTLVTVISFYFYTVVEGKPLTAPVAFTALSLFTLLRSPLDQLADMTAIVIQSKVSLDRISDFLEEEESKKYEQLSNTPTASSPLVGFENASFSWNILSDKDFKLKDLDIAFRPGKLNIIVGPTGSGKTSLLLALLGEMDLTAGKVHLPGVIPRSELVIDPRTGLTESVAYCSQGAWLLNDTIRNNIIFASPFNQERYDRVIEACGLTRDLQILSAGDQTEIGEKGITLSGGQKQRVSLSRALYSNSRYVLLDDCLSAVDSHTASWIYENCISGPLMANRTCILVSHNVALTVQKADMVVVLKNGRVVAQGSPEDLIAQGHLGEDELVRTSVMNSRSQSSANLKTLEDRNVQLQAKADAIEAKLVKLNAQDTTELVETDGKLIEEETKSDGVVSLKFYTGYAKEIGGWFTWTCILFVFLISQGFNIIQSWWLKTWAQNAPKEAADLSSATFYSPLADIASGLFYKAVASTLYAMSYISSNADSLATAVKHTKENNSTMFYILIYGIIGLLYAFVATNRVLWTFLAGVRASNSVFKKVLRRILRAKLRFFDKTPLGRIMNRFSKDIESIDQELTPYAEGMFAFVISCISILSLITVITPGFLFFACIIAYFYYLVGTYYISLSRELKRFDSITRSPIHQHFSESLTGVATIRAYGVEMRFMKHNLAAVDNNNRPFFYMWVANRWLSLRADAVGAMVMLCAGIFVILSIGRIDAGLAGLSLSYAISFSENALWIVRLYANVEMNMNSVERLQEFMEVEQEPPVEIPETKPPADWPQHGEIDVKDLSLRYAPELPRVIKNATFHVKLCSKIGIVGRTGAGKSTIITAFFRFLEAETGSIAIDGVDISKIGLNDLRQAITIIPQDPTLFTGTIRSNLDPFEQFTDEQIFEALTRVNLIAKGESAVERTGDEENQNKFLDINSTVSEGGNNLSQGQRQLMCLARSLLKSPKVILLDEATASIDYKSDAMIQQTIRDQFSLSTILTIAHRLRSIIDYDMILVMDAGKVVEYDDPYALIANKDSLFYSMCDNSGELDSLIKLAKASFVEKKNKNR